MLRQLLLLCLLLSAIQTQAEDFPGVQYVRAYDADTITVNLKDLPPVFGEELGIRVRVSRLQRFVGGVLRKSNWHYRPGIVCENYWSRLNRLIS